MDKVFYPPCFIIKMILLTSICFSILQLEVPKELISSEQLQELKLQRSPSFVPVDQETNATKIYEEDTGITQRRLSNGIPVNYRVSHFYICTYSNI